MCRSEVRAKAGENTTGMNLPSPTSAAAPILPSVSYKCVICDITIYMVGRNNAAFVLEMKSVILEVGTRITVSTR